MQKYIIEMVIAFVLTQLARFKGSTDWAKLRAEVEVVVRASVPGEIFDNAAVSMCNAVIDGLQSALPNKPANLTSVAGLLDARKWDEAHAFVKSKLTSDWGKKASSDDVYPTSAVRQVVNALGDKGPCVAPEGCFITKPVQILEQYERDELPTVAADAGKEAPKA